MQPATTIGLDIAKNIFRCTALLPTGLSCCAVG